MLGAKPWSKAAVERRIVEYLVKQHRPFGEFDRPIVVRQSGMEISDHLIHVEIHRRNPQLIEKHDYLVRDLEELDNRLINGSLMVLLPLHDHVMHPVLHIRLGDTVQGAEIIRFIMIAGGKEKLALLVNERSQGIIRGKENIRPVGSRAMPLGLEINDKAGFQLHEDIVQLLGQECQLIRYGSPKVRPAVAPGSLDAAILVDDDGNRVPIILKGNDPGVRDSIFKRAVLLFKQICSIHQSPSLANASAPLRHWGLLPPPLSLPW